MANYEPDKEMFDAFKESIKGLSDQLQKWQQKEAAIHSLAEVSAKQSGAPEDQMDAHTYAHKRLIKKSMAENAKVQAEGQGVPSAQGGPGNSQGGNPGPFGPTGTSQAANPNPSTMVARQTGPLPMAGQSGNTGANGDVNALRPNPIPQQGAVQQGAPSSVQGPVATHALPGMPTPAPTGGPRFGRMASQSNTLPSAQPPLTQPMR